MQIFIPPELANIEDDIRRFVDAMVFKLRKNAHKGRWEDMGVDDSFARMEDEFKELNQAINEGNSMEILMESADVANFAMILANIAVGDRNGRNHARPQRTPGVGGRMGEDP